MPALADSVHLWKVHGRAIPASSIATVAADLSYWARRQPERPFMTWCPTDGGTQVISYGSLERRTRALVRHLGLAHTVGEAEPVALLADNHPACVVAMFALLRAGVPCLFLDPRDPPRRVDAILSSHPVTRVLATAERAAQWHGLAEVIPDLSEAETSADRLNAPDDEYNDKSRELSADAPALLFATSGSTAASKLVVQPHRALTSNAEAVRRHHRLDEATTVMGGLPIHHVNGVHFTLLGTLHAGAHVVLPQEFSAFTYRDLIDEHQPEIASVVPPVLETLLITGRGWRPPASLRYFVSAAAPLSTGLIRRVVDQLGVRVIQGYGLTETTNFATTVPVDASDETYRAVALDVDIPSVGVAVAGNEVEVLAADATVLGEHVVGEICMRGHNIMTGYARRDDLTAAAFAGGWFHSGDLGFWTYGPDGRRYFSITGRTKNIAKVRGEAVSLEEVERALLSIDTVLDAGCIAVPHQLEGEQLVALIATTGDGSGDLDAIRTRLASLVPPVAVPARWHHLPRIPRTPTGKLARPELAHQFGAPA